MSGYDVTHVGEYVSERSNSLDQNCHIGNVLEGFEGKCKQ
jgi:hypothetical protein